MNILITGASGFVGSALVNHLVNHTFFSIRAMVRNDSFLFPSAVQTFPVGDLASDRNLSVPLEGVDVVIHTAARVHVQPDNATDPLAEFRRVNVAGTLNLARQAKVAGVQRFIYISSIKVNGEATVLDSPFTEDDLPAPADPYAVSKFEAEVGLRLFAQESGLEVVIIRPPLVYGPGVKANFQTMLGWLKWGIPLPLGAIYNKRSLVALGNIVDLLMTCIDHPAAANQTFLAGDGEDLSTTELLQRTAKAMGKTARLIPVPVKLLEFVAGLLGRQAIAQRLCGSLHVDISKAQNVLNWTPPISVDEGLHRAVGCDSGSLFSQRTRADKN